MADNSIKTILYSTIHRNKKTVAQIADEIGISSNYLSRAALPLDESGVRFPLDYLIPVMKATKDYSILKHIAKLCGFILVKIPCFKGHKGESFELIDLYQTSIYEALKGLKDFFTKPTKNNYDKAEQLLLSVLENTVAAQKYIEKTYSGQLELEFK